MSKPELIAIDHDDYHARHIGRLPDGRQFLLTTPFIPRECEFVALYLFDTQGRLLEARIDDLGTREKLDQAQATRIFEQRLEELGPIEYCRIQIQPFEVERFGTAFGLIPRPPEDDGDIWVVEMQPGNCMAFFEPWDSGDYDT